MTKTELVTHVSERLPYMTHKDAEIIVDTIFESMADTLAQGDGIEIRGFGSLKVKDRAERVGRNPKTGEVVRVPPKVVVDFKMGKRMKVAVNQPPPAEEPEPQAGADLRGGERRGDGHHPDVEAEDRHDHVASSVAGEVEPEHQDGDGEEVASLFTEPAWGGIGDPWINIVATNGAVFDEVRILGAER